MTEQATIESPAAVPAGWDTLTPDEWQLIFVRRAERMTGHSLHKRDGLFYIWKMGRQPVGDAFTQLARPTIGEAVQAYLERYLPNDRNAWNAEFADPVPRPAA